MTVDTLKEARKILRKEIEALENTTRGLNDGFVQAVKLMRGSKGKVIVTGVGKSGLIGQKIAATMASTGTVAIFMHSVDAMHGDLGIVGPNDIVLAISHSGQSAELIALIKPIRKIGAKIVAMVGNLRSDLAKGADCAIHLNVAAEADHLNLAPTSSALAALAIGDALALILSKLRNFKNEDFALYHPGGLIGRRLLMTVKDLMHGGAQHPMITPQSAMEEILDELTEKKLGGVNVVDNRRSRKLLGFISDGDLKRQLKNREKFFDLTAEKIMTRNPVTICEDDKGGGGGGGGRRMPWNLWKTVHRRFMFCLLLIAKVAPWEFCGCTTLSSSRKSSKRKESNFPVNVEKIRAEDIRSIVSEVIAEMGLRSTGNGKPARGSGELLVPPTPTPEISGQYGVFTTMEEAIEAAGRAQRELMELSIVQRNRIIAALRETSLSMKEDFAARELAETGMGRLDHKIAKFDFLMRVVPGTEILTTEAFSGDRGLTIQERAPYGVIGAITPSTHAVPTLVNNAICMIAGGNSVVFNPHPASKRVFAYALGIYNRAMMAAGAPPNLITCAENPTLESGKELFSHRGIRLLVVTGGPAVVAEALRAPKKAICAGPGNPPVVVDETADIARAAESIIEGAGFDNNIICIGEKEIFVVNSVADALKRELLGRGCVELNREQIDRLAKEAFRFKDGAGCGSPILNREMIGRDASALAERIGLKVAQTTPLLIGETENDHLFVQEEQMMPFIPIVRCKDVHEAIDRALEAEHGYCHTAVIHSTNIENMSRMARLVNTTLFVKNGPSLAGLGGGGEGYGSFTIASPTGEGITTALSFTRMRRCTLVDYFRIV